MGSDGKRGRICIGTSGWSYDHWQGILYPKTSDTRKRLVSYLERYDTVEVNYSYYRWPSETTFQSWADRVPDGFLMTVKASGAFTHRAHLKNPRRSLDMMEPGLRILGDKCGVLLCQLPGQFGCDLDRLRDFLEALPGWYRVSIEFRHPSWDDPEVFRLLEQHGVAYCIMSGARLPCLLRVTAPFVYVRLHGPDPNVLYAGSYSDDDMRWWANHINGWTDQGLDVFAYFNNDGYGNALRNADTLKQFCGQ